MAQKIIQRTVTLDEEATRLLEAVCGAVAACGENPDADLIVSNAIRTTYKWDVHRLIESANGTEPGE